MELPNFERKDFVKDVWDAYGYYHWRKYLRMTREQKTKLMMLKNHVGQEVQFIYRGKKTVFLLVAVITEANEVVEFEGTQYRSYPYYFRLRRIHNPNNAHPEFWTSSIDNLMSIDIGVEDCLTKQIY